MGSGVLRVARGGSGAKAPPLAARPCTVTASYHGNHDCCPSEPVQYGFREICLVLVEFGFGDVFILKNNDIYFPFKFLTGM